MADTYQVVVTKTAKKDINEILDYLLEKVSYQEAVDTRQSILTAINSLEKMPQARSLVKEARKPTTLRQVIAKKVYRVIYRIEEVKKNVLVVRVIHVKRGTGYVKKALR